MSEKKENPYVGPSPFPPEKRELFFGREREARDLLALVVSEQLVLFYAQSGAGKSSLINTRLIPNLESKNYKVLRVGRVGGGDAISEIETENIYITNLIRSLVQREINPFSLSGLSLSEFLAKLNIDEKGYFYDEHLPESKKHKHERRALIIDQFEELFSTHPEFWEKREDFFAQIAQAMQHDPYLGVIFVMREDYVASLEPYARLLPGRLRGRYYMQRLERAAALQAIKRPVEMKRPYAEGVAEKLVDDLCSIKVQNPDGTPSVHPGQYVEPVQLQVVCYRLWENLSAEGSQITEKDLEQVGDVDQALEKHYAKRVEEVAELKGVSERVIREWFGKKLITSGGVRNIVLKETSKREGELDDEVIQALQSDLVRAEKRGGATFYELTHDRMVEPIIENNKDWDIKNSSPFRQQAELWKQSNGKDIYILGDQALDEANQWAKDHQDKLTDIDNEFLEACRTKQKEREEERKRQAQQQMLETTQRRLELTQKLADEQARSAQGAKRFTAVALGLVLIAIFATVFAFVKANSATAFANIANTAKATAVAAEINAQAGALSAYAIDKLSSQPDLAILLSLEADQIHSDLHTRNALLTSLQETAYIQSFLDQTVKADEAQFSPDGKILALRNKDGITLWDAKSLQPLTTPINEHFREVTALALSKDGKVMASASCAEHDGDNNCKKSEIVLWDAQTGKPLGDALTGHKNYVYSVGFSPDGKILASGSFDNTIILWDISIPSNPFKIAILIEHTGFVESVAFSPDGKMLASASNDQTVRLWDAHTGKQIGKPLSGHASSVLFVTFSPNSKVLASGGDNGDIILWNVATSKAIGVPLSKHTGAVWYMAFSPDGMMLASGSADQSVILWDVEKHQPIGESLTGHESIVWSVAFSPNGKIVASSGGDGKIILWDVAKRKPFGKPLTQHKKAVYSLAFSPDGDKLVSGSLDSTIIYWDVTKPASPHVIGEPLKGHLDQPTAMQFSSDGSLVASTGNDGTILLDVALHTLIGYGDLVSTNLNDSIMAYQINDKSNNKTTIHIRDAITGQEISAPIPGENPLFSPNGEMLVYQTDQTQLHLWDVAAKKKLPAVIVGENPIFSPDSKILIYQTNDGQEFILWNIAEAESIGQPIPGTFLAISPDNAVLVYGTPGTPDPETGDNNIEIHQWSIDKKEAVLDESILRTFLGVSQNGDMLAFKTVDADGIEGINLLELSTGVVSNDLVESGGFLALSANGGVLLYASHDSLGDYVNAINTKTGTPIGKPITGTFLALRQVGQVLAYEIEVFNNITQESEPSIAFIDTSTVVQIGEVVPNGSYLGQARDGEVLVYQIVENKKSMINLLDTVTGLPIGESIRGNFLAINADGKTVVFRNESDSIVLWDTTRTWPLGVPVAKAPENVTRAALSLDGKTLAWVGKDGIALQNVIDSTMIGDPFNNHFGNVTSVYFRPDDKTLIARGEDGNLTIWDYTTHLQAGETLQLSADGNIQISKDGKILVATDSNNGTTALWDLITRKQIGDVIAGSNAVISPNGTVLAAGNSSNNTTTLWNLTTYQPRGKPIPGAYPTFNPDGKLLVIGDYDNNRTIFWNLDPFEETGHEIPGYYGTFSSDGITFANYDTNDTTTLWNLGLYTEIGKPYQGGGSLSPDGKLLAVGSYQDDKTTLWDVSDPNHPSQLLEKPLPGSRAIFNPSGNLLAVYQYDSNQDKNLVSIFDLTNPEPKRINLQPVSESDFAFGPDPDVDRVAYVEDKGIVIWDRKSQLASGDSRKIYPGVISGLTFNKSSDTLAVFGNRGVVLWDINNNTALGAPLPGSVIPGTGITISPNGRIFASQATDGIVLTNLDTHKDTQLETGEYSGQLTSNMSFYANSTRFVTIGDDGTLLSWDVSGGEPDIPDDEKQPLKGKSNTLSVFSSDGRYLAYDIYGSLTIWDMLESQPYMKAGVFPETESSIGAITFSSDGTLLAYTDGPKILLWNILKKENLGELLTGSNNIARLSLIMNNEKPQYLVSADDSGTTQIWDWATRTKIGSPMSRNLQIVGFNNSSRTIYYIDPTGRLIQWQWGLTVKAWKQLLCPLVRRNFTQEEWKLYFPDEKYQLTCPDFPAGQ